VDALKQWNFNVCTVFLLDTHFLLDGTKFLAGALTTLSTMISLETPAVNVLSKLDLLSAQEREKIDAFLEGDAKSVLDTVSC